VVKFGAHAFVWVGEWNTESGNYAIKSAGETGFDFIEIPLLKPQEFDIQSHKHALSEAGIYATCSLVLPKDAHMPDKPDAAYDFLMTVLDVMQELGSHYLAGCIAYSLGTLTGKPPTEKDHETIISVLKKLAVEAEKRDITLALEACNRYETYVYNVLSDVRDTVLAVDAKNLKAHADTYHMNIEEEGFYKPIIETQNVLDYIHMSESHRGLVGSGTVNWEQIWQALGEIKFDGNLVLESFAAINPDLAAATCLWRPPNESSDVLANEGLKFLKEGAAKVGLF
jgi:D-psicose/D-tagatose/L-ribulose 3-epimerase